MLAGIKNPPVVIAKQANIVQDHQQVNNCLPAGDPVRALPVHHAPPQRFRAHPQGGENGLTSVSRAGDPTPVGLNHRRFRAYCLHCAYNRKRLTG